MWPLHVPVNVTCSPNQFKCNNSRCVPYVWRCDNDNDCGDGSDEPSDCHNQTCKPGHFKCNISGRCIPEAWKCDGDRDCGEGDNSDEDQDECRELCSLLPGSDLYLCCVSK